MRQAICCQVTCRAPAPPHPYLSPAEWISEKWLEERLVERESNLQSLGLLCVSQVPVVKWYHQLPESGHQDWFEISTILHIKKDIWLLTSFSDCILTFPKMNFHKPEWLPPLPALYRDLKLTSGAERQVERAFIWNGGFRELLGIWWFTSWEKYLGNSLALLTQWNKETSGCFPKNFEFQLFYDMTISRTLMSLCQLISVARTSKISPSMVCGVSIAYRIWTSWLLRSPWKWLALRYSSTESR